jgi:hypothetical protein
MDHPDTKHQRLVAENANGFKYRKHLHCGASTCPFQQEIESKNERQQGEGNAVSLPPSLPPSLRCSRTTHGRGKAGCCLYIPNLFYPILIELAKKNILSDIGFQKHKRNN